MNFINCSNQLTPDIMRKSALFWCENTVQHIYSLLKLSTGTTAVLQPFFKEELKKHFDEFKNIYESLKQNGQQINRFLRSNQNFINLLEKMKFEGFSGYPVSQQSIFHYIYEQRYINAIFSLKNPNANVLITFNFLPFYNQNTACFYNQMYFWSIIGAMHPSLLMGNNSFYNGINGYAKEFLTNITNEFGKIDFRLSSLKRNFKKGELSEIFVDFRNLNFSFLEFLKMIKQNSPKILTSQSVVRFSTDFYRGVEHMIAEHSLVEEINQNIAKILK